MIYEFANEMNAYLTEFKCPLRVYEGAEPDPIAWGPEFITINRVPGGESFGPAHARKNPVSLVTRRVGVAVRVYTQRNAIGTMSHEHVRRCDHIVDLVIAAFMYAATQRRVRFELRSGGPADDAAAPRLASSENPGGAIYELRALIDRDVAQQVYDAKGMPGAKRPTVTIQPTLSPTGPVMRSTTRAYTIGEDPNSGDTGCS